MNLEEFYEKYSGYKVKFSRYYKFTFYYTYEDNNIKLTCSNGGDSSDIYKTEVLPNDIEIISKYDNFYSYKIEDRKSGNIIYIDKDIL